MKKRKPSPSSKKVALELGDWLASEDVKRRLGAICTAVNEGGGKIFFHGSPDRPTIVLEDSDGVASSPDESELSIDDARANWSTIVAAVLFYGARFRIRGKRVKRAIIYRHPTNRHAATN
jgi:hypothetical protein